jgi:hypothetical protein
MKKVTVKAVRQFLTREGLVKQGDTFETDEKRAAELVKAGRVQVVPAKEGK